MEPLLILCGGLSTRMGQSKPLLPYKGKSLIAHHVACTSLQRPIWLASASQSYLDTSRVEYLSDYFPERQGPLAAILPALYKVRDNGFKGVNIISCDTLIPVETLISLLQTSNHQRAWRNGIVALSDNKNCYPLLARWSLNVLPNLEQTVLRQRHRVMTFFHEQYNFVIEMPKIWYDIANFNSLDEYQRAVNSIKL